MRRRYDRLREPQLPTEGHQRHEDGLQRLPEVKAEGYRAIEDWLRGAGRDAVVYPNQWEAPGTAYAVLSPSQVYSPWIAPTPKAMPKTNRLLAAILGYNALRAGEGING